MLTTTRCYKYEKTTDTQTTETQTISIAELHLQLHLQKERRLRSRLQYHTKRGHQYHSKGDIKQAAKSFNECIRISQKLLLSRHQQANESSGIELLFIASHNMAACCNLLASAKRGESILHALYTQLLKLCGHTSLSRNIRLEALSVLDKCLFSLASQMAYIGKYSEIQALIVHTEKLAEAISSDLSTNNSKPASSNPFISYDSLK